MSDGKAIYNGGCGIVMLPTPHIYGSMYGGCGTIGEWYHTTSFFTTHIGYYSEQGMEDAVFQYCSYLVKADRAI